MITNWALVPESLVIGKFDLYVLGMVQMLARRIVDPAQAAKSIELRTDVLDRQLEHIQSARN